MELWEFNACIAAYNERHKAEQREQLYICWQTANFTGAAFGGKLKSFSHYDKETEAVEAPKVSKEEFERLLSEVKRGEQSWD